MVKRGDIRGRTVGDVDDLKERVETILSQAEKKRVREVRSQIEQALAHPAKMKSSLNDLPVSKVYVVLAGEFSTQGRDRLRSELASKVECFDISWLIENFTKFYPQIFFEGRVIDFIEKKIQELEKKHWLEKTGKNLSEYFVEPLIRAFSDPINFVEGDLKDIKKILERKKLPFFRLGELCKRKNKLILLGDPGTGKTGALAKLAIEMYKKAHQMILKKSGNSGKLDTKISVPVFTSARKLLEVESVECFLEAYFKSETVADRFNVNVIMVDGLDEIESENRHVIINKLDKFSESIGTSYILTSRKIDIINTLSEKYQKYELLPFEFSQAIQFFSKLIKDQEVLGTMREGLEKIRDQVLLVPLSLMLLIELVKTHKEIPASITELYDRFFDMALGRWDEAKDIKVLFEYLFKKRFLWNLAYYEFWKKNRLEIPAKDFDNFLRSYAAQYGWERDACNNFVLEIERAGILNQREEVNFKHRSFLDYFVALYIHENRGDIPDLKDLIVKTYFNSRWSEVSFFYIGLRREISPDLLHSIDSYEGETSTAIFDKLLSGRLLQAGWHSPTQTHIDGIKKAIEYVPRVHETFQSLIDSSKPKIPDIMSDFIVLTLTDHSFNSGFLQRPVKEVLNQLITSESHDDIYKAVALHCSVYRFLDPSEIDKYTNALLDRITNLETKEQVRILLLMTLVEADKKIMRLMRRKINRIIRKSPEIFRALLPAKEKGFR